ncbi:PREDICTED: porimin [Condylura cristata]|uniref:porimin n=1 Tax=Condylura cristata TaxID=143302 RepID=UPI000643C763|nr:PREDICTED: porimin [Condylura cristata]
MGLGARGAWAMVALGILLVMTLIKLAVDTGDSAGSPVTKDNILPGNYKTNLTGNIPLVPASNGTTAPSTVLRSKNPTGTTVNLSTTPVSSVSKYGTGTTKKSTTPATSSTAPVSSPSRSGTTTTTTMKPVTPSNTTLTTTKSTTKKTSASPTTTQKTSTSSVTTAHNSSVTSASSSVTVTATVNSKDSKSSKFDTGSFFGGIVLTLGVVSILYLGCRVYYSRRGIQYRTIDEHDAII